MLKVKISIILLICAALSAFPNPLDKALCDAAKEGNLSRIKELVEAGADINNREGENGATPLHIAARNNLPEVMKYLLARKADIDVKAGLDAKAGYEVTPLFWASTYCNVEAVEVLIKAGADLETREPQTLDTPLLSACRNAFSKGGVETVKLLLAAGADTNARSKDKSTPLMCVAFYGSTDLCKLLIKYKADPTAKRSDGLDAYQIALAAEQNEAAAYLKKATLDYQQKNNDNELWNSALLLL